MVDVVRAVVDDAKPSDDLGGGSQDTEFESVPKHWGVTHLGNIATLQRGKDLPSDQRHWGPYPVVGSNGIVGYHAEYVTSGPGVLVGRSGSVGKVTWIEGNYWPLNTALWVKDFHGNDPEFVSYLLSHLNLRRYAAGVSVPTLNRNLVHPIRIALPPLPEQRAIGHVLRTVQQAKEATEAVIAATRALKKSLMRHLFTYGPVPVDQADQVPLKETEIGTVPEHWEITRLGDVSRIGNGSTPKRSNSTYWEDGHIPWLTSGKVHEIRIGQADEFVTPLAREECHLPLVPRNSVVVAITGQGKTLGTAALVTFDTCVSQHLAYIQFQDSRVLPEFVLAFLQHRYHDLRAASRGGGSTKNALTCGFLKGYWLPIPPVEEQRTISVLMAAVDRKLDAEETRKQALEALFSSLLHHLMTGVVRVHDVAPALEEVG